MSYLLSLITIIISILAIHLLTEILMNFKKLRDEKRLAYLDVLKVMTKQECLKKFEDNPNSFVNWISTYLLIKGYKNIKQIPAQEDNGVDLTAINAFGQETYILCKLDKSGQWDNKIATSSIKELIGTLVGNSVKCGLVITMADIDEKSREYLTKVNNAGFNVKYIDGNVILEDLYHLRPSELRKLIPVNYLSKI